MTLTVEQIKRAKQTILDTYKLLNKAIKNYEDSIESLKMEVEENKTLGNPASCNKLAAKRANECKARIQELKKHLTKLENMVESKLV